MADDTPCRVGVISITKRAATVPKEAGPTVVEFPLYRHMTQGVAMRVAVDVKLHSEETVAMRRSPEPMSMSWRFL